ncbi:MAG: hypothetical protein IH944_08100 [Armatimonadetes bacterium]|nr:hypothetical protein [Armatimonadota bacterium]
MITRVVSVLIVSVIALLTPAALAEQDRREEMTAKQFLEWSMDQHAKLKTYQAMVLWDMGKGDLRTRLVLIEGPDKYAVTSSNRGYTQVSVCDGTTLLEYDSEDAEALEYRATSHIGTSPGMQMNHPHFCGSLLYKFFLGSDHLDQLAILDRQEIEYGPRVTLADGRTLQSVKFYGAYLYGHVVADINVSTGLVERLKYDSEPVMQVLKDMGPEGVSKFLQDVLESIGEDIEVPEFPEIGTRWTTEHISVVATDAPLSSDIFSTATPNGIETRRMTSAWPRWSPQGRKTPR